MRCPSSKRPFRTLMLLCSWSVGLWVCRPTQCMPSVAVPMVLVDHRWVSFAMNGSQTRTLLTPSLDLHHLYNEASHFAPCMLYLACALRIDMMSKTLSQGHACSRPRLLSEAGYSDDVSNTKSLARPPTCICLRCQVCRGCTLQAMN